MKNKLLLLLALVALPAWAGGMDVQLKGKAKDVAALTEQLKQDKSFQDASCSVKSKSKVHCDQASGALLEFLDANAGKVRWSIAGAAAAKQAMKAGGMCPPGCTYTNCPPPGGPARCCNTTTWQPC